MTCREGCILGLLQGITEFLPVSSSGHLLLAQRWMGLPDPEQNLAYVVMLHLATALSVLLFFGGEIIRLIRQRPRWLGLIVIGSFPAGVVGVFYGSSLARLSESPIYLGAAFCCTGGFLLVSEWVARGCRIHPDVEVIDGFLIGMGQAAAVVPGVSRLGLTIGSGLLCGVDRFQAVLFSFLLSLPAVGGAALLVLREAHAMGDLDLGGPVWLGGAIAFAVGYGTLHLLVPLVRSGRWHWFGWYTLALGVWVGVCGMGDS
jgi:undecaprenyl-diphosphatase